MDELNTFLTELIKLIGDSTYVAVAAPLVLILVQLCKYIKILDGVNAGVLQLFFQVVAWVPYIVGKYFGLEQQYFDLVTALTLILKALLPVTLSIIAASSLFEGLKAKRIPWLGYART